MENIEFYKEFTLLVQKIIKETPNDLELGEKIRELYNKLTNGKN